MLATILALLDAIVSVLLLIAVMTWGRRMLALHERLVSVLSPQALQILREVHVDTRDVKRRLTE